MMGNFDNTRSNYGKLKDHWREANFDARFDIGLTITGLGLMLYAVVAQFGGLGMVFIIGMWLHKMGRL